MVRGRLDESCSALVEGDGAVGCVDRSHRRDQEGEHVRVFDAKKARGVGDGAPGWEGGVGVWEEEGEAFECGVGLERVR